jgi:hypothetical protein
MIEPIGFDETEDKYIARLEAEIDRLQGIAQSSRNAVIDECVKAAFSVRYGSPSSRHDKNPKGWHLPRDCTPTDAAMHDNGCIDAAKAIRALSTVSSTHSQTKIIEPIESVGLRGAQKQAIAEHASMVSSTHQRPGPEEGAGLTPASDRKDQSLVEEGSSTLPLAATLTSTHRGGGE